MPCLSHFPKTGSPKMTSQKRVFYSSLCRCVIPFDTFEVIFTVIFTLSQNHFQTGWTHTPHPEAKFSSRQKHHPDQSKSTFFLAFLDFWFLSFFETIFAIYSFAEPQTPCPCGFPRYSKILMPIFFFIFLFFR